MSNITVTTSKGGVGKSSQCLHVSTALAINGFRVGVIDTDSQGHISRSLNIKRHDGLYAVVVDDEPLSKHLQEVESSAYSVPDMPAKGAMYVLPSSDLTYKIARDLNFSNIFRVLEVVENMKEQYKLDFVFFDTSPTVQELDAFIFYATDAFLFITELEDLSADGLRKATSKYAGIAQQRQKYMNAETTILGIIPNKVRGTQVHALVLDELKQEFGDLIWPSVALRTAWAEASYLHETLYTYKPNSKAAHEAWATASRTLQAVSKWQLEKRS